MSYQPPPPYGGPPQPWGPPPPPPQPGGMAVWAQVLAGTAIGLFVGGALMVVVLFLLFAAMGDGSGEDLSGEAIFALVVLIPMVCPVPLLFFRQTRMWGVGLIIGTALTTISLAGACAWIITGLSEGSA